MNNNLNALNSKVRVAINNEYRNQADVKYRWVLDPDHSELGFTIRYLMINKVSGRFTNFDLLMETDDIGFTSATADLKADIKSVSTNNEERDAHLLASEFFEADQYPELRFKSTRFESTGKDSFAIYGDLSMKGKRLPVKLSAKLNGLVKDPLSGEEKAGFTIKGKINRNDWNVNFNSVLESGGMMLGETVRINSEIQLIKQIIE